MNLEITRNRIYKKYQRGQTITLRYYNNTGEPKRHIKATIVQFYPYHVSCLVKGHRESFSYWDIADMTSNRTDREKMKNMDMLNMGFEEFAREGITA